ncbi:MAG: hypothetical protein EPN97_18185 [Alphaproteobacteria bacterium]|nr:MAG: hypothetical protein EPN97_18185 [Alphaproteobacteria bacterium]
MKVHVIEADLSGKMTDVVRSRDELGKQIANLANTVNEPVFFHEFKNPMAGAPVIMLECSDAFLAEVRKLPAYKKDHEAWKGKDFETERSPTIQAYFTSKAGPDCKIIPPPKHRKPPTP